MEQLIALINLVGVPVVLFLLYGPPTAMVVYFAIFQWNFMGQVIENNSKIITILEELRDARK